MTVPGNLPAHFNPGRGTHTGPVSGGCFELSFSLKQAALASGANDFKVRAPFDLVVHRVAVTATAESGSIFFSLVNDTDSVDIVAATGVTAGTTGQEIFDVDNGTLSNVEVTKGDALIFRYNDSTGSETLNETVTQMFGYVVNHVHVDDAND